MKKVLSIVLSLAMVVCLMPAAFADSTGSKTFTDADSITNKEAVDVLSGLGIINGMDDGSFNPTGDVTREQSVTLIDNLVKSGSFDPASETVTADPFTDVAADRWSAPYIQYGVKNDILQGMGDGTFAPEANVTTSQLAKMLLVVLGYSNEDVAINWPENTMALAQTADLLTGISKGANENLTREETAQMIFNALKTDTVVKVLVSGSDSNSGYRYINSDATKYNDDGIQQLVEKLFPNVSRGAELSEEGRPSIVWKDGKTPISETATAEPLLTYTKAVSDANNFNTVKQDLKNAGLEYDTDTAASIQELTGNGVKVEVFDIDEDDKADYVVVTEQGYAVATIGTKDDEATTTEDESSLKIGDLWEVTALEEVDGYADVYAAAAAEKSESTPVLITGVGAGSLSDFDAFDVASIKIEVPTNVVTGPVTKVTKNGITVNGTEYQPSENLATDLPNQADAKKDYKLTLDQYGYVIAAEEVVKEEEEVATEYLYVLRARQTSSTSDDPYDDSTTTTVIAQVAAVDGTVSEITVSKVNGEAVSNKAAVEALAGQVVSYVVKNDKYELTEVEDQYDLEGKLEKKVTSESGVKANSKTIYLVGNNLGVDKDGNQVLDTAFTVSTGYVNAPALTVSEGTYTVVDGFANIVVVTGEEEAAPVASKDVYFFPTAAPEASVVIDSNTYTQYAAIVNGEAKTVYVAADVRVEAGVYNNVTVDTKDASIITKLEGAVAPVDGAGSVTLADGVLTVGGEAYTPADSLIIFNGDKKQDTASKVEIEDADYVVVLTDRDGAATAVYAW